MIGSSGAMTFLLGRLALERRTPEVALTVSAGRWPTLAGPHAFAVSDGRLWLAQPRLIGEPDVASVPLDQVGPVRLRPPLCLELELGGVVQRYRVLDDADACRAFVEAVQAGRAAS